MHRVITSAYTRVVRRRAPPWPGRARRSRDAWASSASARDRTLREHAPRRDRRRAGPDRCSSFVPAQASAKARASRVAAPASRGARALERAEDEDHDAARAALNRERLRKASARMAHRLESHVFEAWKQLMRESQALRARGFARWQHATTCPKVELTQFRTSSASFWPLFSKIPATLFIISFPNHAETPPSAGLLLNCIALKVDYDAPSEPWPTNSRLNVVA